MSAGIPPVHIIASDSMRNLYNQHFLPTNAGSPFSTRSAARLDIDGLRDTCRRWSVASDDRWNVV